MPNFGTSSNVPIGGSRGAKGSQALFRAKLLFFFAVAFFWRSSSLEKIGKIHQVIGVVPNKFNIIGFTKL